MIGMSIIRNIPSLIMVFLLISCSGAPQLTTYHRPNAIIDLSSPIVVVPAKMGKTDDLVLPDAIATELLGMGLNVVERTTLSQMVKARGLDFTEIVTGEEYFKLGGISNIRTVVIVNSILKGVGVANATVRVVDVRTGDVILSTTYNQPAPDNPTYARHHSLTDTARVLAESIRNLVRK